MKCADPVLCYTHNGKRIFRHFSLSSDTFKQIHNSVFNCGKCLFCRKKKAYELASRCVLHASCYLHSCFITLTYDETKKTYHNNFQYSDIQKFKKRLRKKYAPKKIEIFNVHEYGKNGKKHWHLIIFNHDFDDKKIHTYKNAIPLYTSIQLSDLWPAGFSTVGDVSEASAMYQAQYMEKDFAHNHIGTSKKSHSRHSGLGKPYFLQHYKQILTLGYIPFSGKKMPLPRYFEKLAHKHYSHFHDPSFFFDTVDRKKRYSFFKSGEEKKEIADLYVKYKLIKEEKIIELTQQWEEVLSQYFQHDKEPEFIQSHKNTLHDLKLKNHISKF